MVLNPKKEQVDVHTITMCSLIPILQFYSFWKIQKFWQMQLIMTGLYTVTVGSVILLLIYTENTMEHLEEHTFTLLGLAVIISLVSTALITRRYAQKYNSFFKRDDMIGSF